MLEFPKYISIDCMQLKNVEKCVIAGCLLLQPLHQAKHPHSTGATGQAKHSPATPRPDTVLVKLAVSKGDAKKLDRG